MLIEECFKQVSKELYNKSTITFNCLAYSHKLALITGLTPDALPLLIEIMEENPEELHRVINGSSILTIVCMFPTFSSFECIQELLKRGTDPNILITMDKHV